MAQRVRVSSLALRTSDEFGYFAMQRLACGQPAVDQMIGLWQRRLAEVLPLRPDLIVLPELSDAYPFFGGEQADEYHRARGTQVYEFWANIARRRRCYVAYSAKRLLANGSWRNSIQMIDRRGELAGVYDKSHPTIGEIEAGILPGPGATIIECDFGRVGCAICFDLNFDELRLQYAKARPDLIIFSSVYHGGLMQPYWAYSCRAHFVGCVAGLPSAILSPVGSAIATTTNYFPFVTATVNLDVCVAHLDYNWERLKTLQAKYGDHVRIHDPGLLGSVLISSESNKTNARQMAKECGIELLDDYFKRALACRRRHRQGKRA